MYIQLVCGYQTAGSERTAMFPVPRLMYSQLMCVLCGHGVGEHHLELFGHCKMVAICGERSLKDKIQYPNTLGSLTTPT